MRSPVTAADALIELPDGAIVLVRRRNPPPGWAIPGGFIEPGESAESAAIREAREETGLDVTLNTLLGVYSEPGRDPRHHTLTIVYTASATGTPRGGDDAAEARSFQPCEIPGNLAFDHPMVLDDYFRFRRTGTPPSPRPSSHLSDPERQSLLSLAFDAISGVLGGPEPSSLAPSSPRLEEPGGAFVSLHRGGELRGCLGDLSFAQPLSATVAAAARAAAFEDPRFPPLSREELDHISIEISVLTRPEALPPSEIVAGLHGICLAAHGRRATFLPQVAREHGWSQRRLLQETCLKAGLPRDAWQDDDAVVEAFTAEVFGAR